MWVIIFSVMGWLATASLLYRLLKISHHRHRLQDLAFQIVHDIRSPLGTLAICLGRAEFPDERTKDLAIRSCVRAEELSESFLRAREMNFGPQYLGKESRSYLSLSQMVQTVFQVLESKRVEFENREVRFRSFDLTDDLAEKSEKIWIDLPVVQLESCISNLINNAVRACANRGAVILTVETDVEEETLSVVIRDTGCGLSVIRWYLAKFSTFWMGPVGSLGLRGALMLAREHGWSLRSQASMGEGTSMILEIPMAVHPKEKI